MKQTVVENVLTCIALWRLSRVVRRQQRLVRPRCCSCRTTAPAVIELDTDAAQLGADWMMVAPEENPKRGGTLTTAWGMSPTHFDLHQGGGCAGCGMMYNGLIMWNVADGYHTIVPALATEWSVSEDQLVYTFTLREGVKLPRWQRL